VDGVHAVGAVAISIAHAINVTAKGAEKDANRGESAKERAAGARGVRR